MLSLEKDTSVATDLTKPFVQDIFTYNNKKFEEVGLILREIKDVDWLKENMSFSGELFLGHLRYGTYGGNSIEHCHPFLRQNNWMTRNLVLAGNFNSQC